MSMRRRYSSATDTRFQAPMTAAVTTETNKTLIFMTSFTMHAYILKYGTGTYLITCNKKIKVFVFKEDHTILMLLKFDSPNCQLTQP
jgi:hypothetical protein